MKRYFFFVLMTASVVFLQSCGGNKPGDVVSPAENPVLDPAKAAVMEFSENTFAFGDLVEGDTAVHVFKFKNTSNNPLVIQHAKGSCGCTVPDYPKEPVAPGAEGEIKVKFNSAGKKGAQSKTVTLTANTIPAETVLTITANVAEKQQ